jgi:hypothetical protein
MNKLLCALMLITVGGMPLIAAVGCMDNSYHLKHTVDHKTYHYVQCNCDCAHHTNSTDRGICSQCGHYRDPGKFEIVHYKVKGKKKKEQL